MVRSGELCFPKAVRTELQQARFVDTPEAWAFDVCRLMVRSYDPLEETVAHVMSVAGSVVDPDAEGDPADPYVLAQAVEIRSDGVDVCVVTNDVVDRLPIKISMRTACDKLGLPWCDLAGFFAAVRFDPKHGWPTGTEG